MFGMGKLYTKKLLIGPCLVPISYEFGHSMKKYKTFELHYRPTTFIITPV